MTNTLPEWAYAAGVESNRPLLLISGLGGTAAFWTPVFDSLAQKFRVVSYDQPGCGLRPRDPGPVSIDSLADDAAALARSIFGDQPSIVIGHSTGGVIAQRLATKQPNLVDRLVLSGTWHQPDRYMEALFAYRKEILLQAPELAGGLTSLLSQDPEALDLDALTPKEMKPAAIETALARIDALLAFDGAPLTARIDTPSLVIGASADRIVPVSRQKALHAALPNSRLTVLEGGGHFFPNALPARFLHEIGGWLGQEPKT